MNVIALASLVGTFLFTAVAVYSLVGQLQWPDKTWLCLWGRRWDKQFTIAFIAAITCFAVWTIATVVTFAVQHGVLP
jgi:hypothetical protein